VLLAWVGEEKRGPVAKGERGRCPNCDSEVLAVVPRENIRHWRHRAGDCDPWSEPEGPWHLGWKDQFPVEAREVSLIGPTTGERHRADIRTQAGVVLELQHSSIPEEEIAAREAFYTRDHRMFWLVHIHNEGSFRGTNFLMSLNFDKRPISFGGKRFSIMSWVGPGRQFIEKWKRSSTHVFFDCGGSIFYLATKKGCAPIMGQLKKGEFALCPLTVREFLEAVSG
jgi:hypothetical protein